MKRGPTWGDLRRQTAEPTKDDQDSFEDLCARFLIAGDGKLLLQHLYARYVDYRCRPGASEADLREAEAKRALVHDLEKARDDGLKRIRAAAGS